MKDRTHSALRRLAAWMVSLWLLLPQFALPAYALTQAEISAMPTVTVSYQTAADAQPTAMPATPTSDPNGKAYWVTLPAEAFGFPITLSVAPSAEAPNYVFDPTEGVITTGADTVDFTGASTVISAYQDGVLMEQYHLYVSAAQMPAEVPPATVQVNYVDADNPATVLYTTSVQAFYNTDNMIAVDVSQVPEGYTLQGDSTATVTVDEYGTANPSTVTFYFQAQAPKQATVYVYYVDAGGNELGNTQTLQLDPGTHDVTPDMGVVPAGYVLTSASPVQVTVADDGTAMPEAVTFEFAQEQEPATEPPATEPPATEPPVTDAPTVTDSTPTEPSVTDTPATEPPAETPAPVLIPVGRYAVTNTVANFRTETSTDSKKAFANVNSGAYVWVYGTLDVTEADGTVRTWASISYNGTDCYVWNSLIDTLSQEDSDSYNYSQPSPVPGTETSAPPQTAEPTATQEPTGTPTATPTQTPLPVQVTGFFITTTDATLAAGAGSDTMLTVVPSDTVVYVEGQNYVDNMAWHKVTYDGMSGYLRGDTVRQMNEQEVSDFYASQVTPTPTVTATPTATPTATVTATATASDSPSPSPSASPTATPTATPTQAANMYVGYGVTMVQTALRQNANLDDNSVITMLPADTLVYLNGQSTVNNVVWSGAQTRLGTAYIGLVQDNAVRRITDAEAQTIIDAYDKAHATATPTASPSPSPVPAQLTGYYITLGDVPMRTVNSNYGNVGLWLAKDTVVSVTGQVYNEGYGWHITNYASFSGYVRTDQLRKLSDAEVEAYKKSIATPTPTPAATVKPYDPYAASSYGYVSAGSVNFRATPSSSSSKLKTLRQYAFALVLGSKTVDGKVWYNINQAGTVGWVDGSYFKVLNLTELSSFINSKEYLTGLTNNSTSGTSTGTSTGSSTGTTTGGSTGSATQGNVSSVEDWNLGVWQNPNSGLNASYAPFNPYATPTAPLVSATPSPEPTSTFVVGTMIPIPYEEESKETQTSSSWVGLTIGGIVLLGGAGGVYAYALNQNKKRRLAARNAANNRRNAQQGGAAGAGAGAAAAGAAATTSPYTRRAVAAPPMTGATRKQDGSEPGTPGSATGSYARPNPYAKPAAGATPYSAGAPGSNTGAAPSPYARPAQEQSPFVRPVTGSAETEESPFTRPADQTSDAWSAETRTGATPVPPRTANPYAQPVQPKPADVVARTSPANPYAADHSATAEDEPANPTPRRTSRASRYQSHDDTPDA